METLPTWDEVLAAVEADADRAAALLAAPPEAPLPADGAPLILPNLGSMPAVPERLRERIETLRDRIGELQRELTDALREWHVPAPVGQVRVAAAPQYLDRAL
ncbi:MAG TPA: hypothetical protein VE442_16180 [Jatrophihabitans sp.]|jgi:hypothetical protein|nr:hypothetical protein [Jatrophihabitans sp.]